MFTFTEIDLIKQGLERLTIDSSENGYWPEEKESLLAKIQAMVSRETLFSIAPCVRPSSDARKKNDVGGFTTVPVTSADRMKVFESERELARDLIQIARDGWKAGRREAVLVSVPHSGLVEPLVRTLSTALHQFILTKISITRGSLEFESGLIVRVVSSPLGSRGMSIDWAFFYNEVSGF